MPADVRVPSMGESVTSAILGRWLKAPGDRVAQDEVLVALDSDKATLELHSPANGVLVEVLAAEGEEVQVGQVVARVEPGEKRDEAPSVSTAQEPAVAPVAPGPTSPSVRRAAQESGLNPAEIAGSGPNGRVTRADVEGAARVAVTAPGAAAAPSVASAGAPAPAAPVRTFGFVPEGEEPEEVVPMTTIRRRIGARLLEAQRTAAILTTFNEIDMSGAMALRERYQERFVKKYGVKLGFMSIFAKAAIEALKAFPSANAEIRGESVVYKHYYHIGVAVSGPRGLVVPVLRHADRLSFSETEKAIAEFGQRARDGQLGPDDLRGGTFTISNGGVFGSLMSTPILNPPQVAILGMHSIQKRAVVVDDQIVIRPMMYVALSYDHRLLDGREAVGTLVRIKECVENPERILLEL